MAVLRAELAKSAFQFGWLLSEEGTAQKRTVHFLRNLREPKLANKRFRLLLEKGNGVLLLPGQREESGEKWK